ncbi:hypothetical protein BN946_scf184902.g22 [Trametes cinnabarina]|uniref:Uncharacterized protein n=1 Tax=Pycnoporus cinnabarinus TaxID=5643 RepID=A0A060SY67_PYCCI|nr:hypothetical protein BN946_scf184902.g22 [Trametes cinnabarina]
MASSQPTHDPALAHVPPAPSNNQHPAAPAQPAQNATQPSVPGSLIPGMANEQVMNLLKHIPELFSRSRPEYVARAFHVIGSIGHVRGGDRDMRVVESVGDEVMMHPEKRSPLYIIPAPCTMYRERIDGYLDSP